MTVRDDCSKRASCRPQNLLQLILVINTKSLYSQEVEEKCPQYRPLEMQSAGAQNVKYSIHFNSLTTEVKDQQIQHFGIRQIPW